MIMNKNKQTILEFMRFKLKDLLLLYMATEVRITLTDYDKINVEVIKAVVPSSSGNWSSIEDHIRIEILTFDEFATIDEFPIVIEVDVSLQDTSIRVIMDGEDSDTYHFE